MTSAASLALIVTVTVSSGSVPPKLVERAIREADTIWRNAGVAIEWHRNEPPSAASLNVRFVDQRGHAQAPQIALAWIDVVGGKPTPDIYVSRASALDLLHSTQYLAREIDVLPGARDEILGRALGRALAHELGHYLFGSRDHDRTGVMATARAPAELFGPDHDAFLLTVAERIRLSQVVERQRLVTDARSPVRASPGGGPV